MSRFTNVKPGAGKIRNKMKRILLITVICLLCSGLPGYGSENKLPVIDGKAVVATVNDEPIFLQELNRAIESSHAATRGQKAAAHIDFSHIMSRLINARLFVIEGRNIGLDQLTGVQDSVDSYSRQTLMELLMKQHVEGISPDEEEIDEIYRKLVKEWQITSVWFETKDAVKKFEEEMKSGSSFEETVQAALKEGTAKDVGRGKYFKKQDLAIPVAELVSKMEIGSVSPILSFGKKGFMIFQIESVRFPEDEDSEARAKAKRQARNQVRVEAARAYYQNLKEKYAKVDEDLLAGLDYEAEEPGLPKLLEDNRAIAEISDEKPITVAELSKALKREFYHGIERALETEGVNERKGLVFESILQKRVVLKEALKQGLDKTEEYKDRVKEYKNSVIFGLFVKKVVTPGIKLDMKELETYHKENSKEYKTPEMMRIKSLVFGKRGDAVDAINKLTAGTDFDWLSSRAEDPEDKNREGHLHFEGKLLIVTSMPEDLQKAISKVKSGDYRLYKGPDGYFYVLYIYQVIPAKLQPFENVKEEIAKKILDDKVKKALEDYADKLKDYYPVKIYAKDLHWR